MIDYNKTTNKSVLENLTMLIAQEFKQNPIRYDDNFNGNTYFKLTPIEDEIVDIRTNGAIREYTIEIQYTERKTGRYTKRNSLDNRVNTIERLKEILRRATASIELFLYFMTSDAENFLTSDGEDVLITRRPLLITGQDDFFITSDGKAFAVYPAASTYDWHHMRLESVNYDIESERPNFLTATAEFKCLVEELYS